jgi:hypothetical protein
MEGRAIQLEGIIWTRMRENEKIEARKEFVGIGTFVDQKEKKRKVNPG